MTASSRLIGGAVAALAIACGGGGGGGGGGTPTSPTPTPGAAATITLAATGVEPTLTRVEVGQQVRFVNSAARNIEVASDPHPTHERCPPINTSVGMITPGQTKTATFTQRGTCTYHDHGNPDDARFRGTILVGVGEPGPAPDYRTIQ